MKILSRRALLFVAVAAMLGATQFPRFEAETLGGQKITLPPSAGSGPVLLIIGFTHGASQQTGYWAKKIPKDLVPTYTVATLGGAPKLMRRMILHSMRNGLSKEQRDRFLVTYDDDKDMKEAAGFKEPDDAYLVLLAPDGTTHWTFHGAFSHTKLKELSDQVRGMRQ